MSQTQRILRIQQILRDREIVPIRAFLDELEISRSQFKRDLDVIRDQFQVEVKWDRARRGYSWPVSSSDPAEFDLPGPLYTASEIHALLLMQDLVSQLQPGLLDQHLAPLRQRFKLLLGNHDLPSEEVHRRIRILHMASRPVEPKRFRAVSEATLARRRLWIRYESRSQNTVTERSISPQRLVFYRGNWYIDSWCHLRNDLRSFAVDAILDAKVLDEHAREIEAESLDAHLGAGYGIMSGPAESSAVLRFDPEAARWVSRELWHASQTRVVETDGHLILTVPYSQEQELLMDVLRWGHQVEVLRPQSLRDLVKDRLRLALARY